MKLNRNSWLAAGASLLLAFVAQPAAQAAQVLYNTGDLILAFRATGGQGANESLLVNIGAPSTYANATGSFDLSIGSIGADLVTQYGSNWYERTDLSWSIFGGNDTALPNATIYGSRAQIPYGTEATAWNVLTNNAHRASTRNFIQGVASAFDGLEALTNPYAALQTNSSDATSYYQQVGVGSNDFGALSQWTSIEGSFGAGSEALNLFRLTSTTTNLGTFTISDAGVVSFSTPAAVPEPSKTVFAMLGVGALFLRRRRVAALPA